MSPDSAGTRRHAWFALTGAATIAWSVFGVLVCVDPGPTPQATGSPTGPTASVSRVERLVPDPNLAALTQRDDRIEASDAGVETLWEVRGKVVDSEGRAIPDVLIAVIQAGAETGQVEPAAPTGRSTPFSADDAAFPATPDNLGVTQGRIPPIPLLAQAPLDADLAAGFVTDTHGHFALTGTLSGQVELLAAPSGWAPSRSAPIDLVPGQRVDGVVLVLRRGAKLEGTAVDSYGNPMTGVIIETTCPLDPVPRSTVSDRDGRFQISGVIGQCELMATPRDLPLTQMQVLAIDGETHTLVVRISAEAHTLECSIEDSRGFPIPRAAVEVRGLSGPGLLAAGLSGPDGQVAIPRLPPPPYRLSVSHPDYAPRVELPITTAVGNRIRLSAGTRIGGSVIVIPGRTPLPAARIEVWSASGLLVSSTRTGDLGTFEVRNLIDGDYSVIVTHAQTVQKRFSRPVRNGGAHDRVADWEAFEVNEGGSISGTVVDRLGVPVPSTHVVTLGGETISDAEGAFALTGLGAGPLALEARHPSAGATTRPVIVRAFAGQDTPGVRLQLAGRFEGDAAGTLDATPPLSGLAPDAPPTPPSPAASRGPAIEVATGRTGVSVVSVAEGSTAARAGLRSGDTIASIDGETVSVAAQARSLLRGEAGTLVALDIRRGSTKQRIKFRRERSGSP